MLACCVHHTCTQPAPLPCYPPTCCFCWPVAASASRSTSSASKSGSPSCRQQAQAAHDSSGGRIQLERPQSKLDSQPEQSNPIQSQVCSMQKCMLANRSHCAAFGSPPGLHPPAASAAPEPPGRTAPVGRQEGRQEAYTAWQGCEWGFTILGGPFQQCAASAKHSSTRTDRHAEHGASKAGPEAGTCVRCWSMRRRPNSSRSVEFSSLICRQADGGATTQATTRTPSQMIGDT